MRWESVLFRNDNSIRPLWLVLVVASAVSPVANAQYGGPSILSRGGGGPGRSGLIPLSISYYAGARGTYDTGLIPVTFDADGNRQRGSGSGGYSIRAGLFGGRQFRRAAFGIDYRADYRGSTRDRNGAFNGINQALSFQYSRALTANTFIGFRQTASTSKRAFGAFSTPTSADDPDLPLDEVFDSRVLHSNSSLTLSQRYNARLSLFVAGGFSFTRRENFALVSSNAFFISSGANYRLSARDTLGFVFGFSQYEYPRVFGRSYSNSFNWRFNRVISPRWSASANLGLFRTDTIATQRVPLDPEVAEILGTTTGIEAFQRIVWRPNFGFNASYNLERGTAFFGFGQSYSPGNGVVLASTYRNYRAGYNFGGLRRMSFAASTSYNVGTSVALDIADTRWFRVGGGWNYAIIPRLNLTTNVDYRRFGGAGGLAGRDGVSMSFGLTVSRSPLPLPVW